MGSNKQELELAFRALTFALVTSVVGCGEPVTQAVHAGPPEAATARDNAKIASAGYSRSEVQDQQHIGATQYPIVLHHGLFGFDRIFDLDYYYLVRQDLERAGYVVYPTRVSPANSVIYRSRQLAHQIDAILQDSGAKRVNIIAHSLGGLDARYLVSTMGYGDRVASITMIATPNAGTAAADIALAIGDGRQAAMEATFRALVGIGPNQDTANHPGAGEVNIHAALEDLSTDKQARFNRNNPDDPRVYYQSFSGRSSQTGLFTGDIINPILEATYLLEAAFEGENDGLVATTSVPWGYYRGSVPADHFDEVGQILGATSIFFNHHHFYEDIAEELRVWGF